MRVRVDNSYIACDLCGNKCIPITNEAGPKKVMAITETVSDREPYRMGFPNIEPISKTFSELCCTCSEKFTKLLDDNFPNRTGSNDYNRNY